MWYGSPPSTGFFFGSLRFEMISLRFLKRVLTLPAAIIAALVKYYSTGTVYLNTNKEFANSPYKNVHMSAMAHLANNYNRNDVANFVYRPSSLYFEKYKNHPLAVGLAGFGEVVDKWTRWLVKNDTNTEEKSAVLFLHGGGYCLNIFPTQFFGILALYYAVPEAKRGQLSVAMVDYSLTCHYKKFPSQIFETLHSYRELVNQGFTKITLVGDSAGTNLAAAVARFIAYPEEARATFASFSEFNWDFSPLPQPANLVFVSPWLEPCTLPTPVPGVDTTGDLGAIDTDFGDWYLEDINKEEVVRFVEFTNSTYEKDWANVDALNGTGRCLYLYGEREILRFGVEKFIDVITKDGQGKLEVHMEEGGIHDALFYVESLDYIGKAGANRALAGDFQGKFGYTVVGNFLGEVI